MKRVGVFAVLLLASCATTTLNEYTLDDSTPVDAQLQARIEQIDSDLRAKYGIAEDQTDVGVLDLKRGRLAAFIPQPSSLIPRFSACSTPDPIANHSHAVTVRQLLRFYLMLEQGKLVSREASKTMKEIFASPDIPHDDLGFVRGLAGRDVHILRKWGSWQDWRHDSAIVTGPGRHYIIAGLTKNPRGDEYLVDLARAVDDLMQ